jgi:hypothetical protein
MKSWFSTSSRRWLTSTLGLTLLTVSGLSVAFNQPSVAQQKRFFCGTSKDVQGRTFPATYAYTPGQGNVPMFLWVSDALSGSGLSPAQRCQEVATRFQRHYENKTLRFIRTGAVKGYPVVCIAKSRGGACPENQVLVTLAKGTDAKPVLSQLLDLRRRSSGNPIMLNGGDVVFYEEGEVYVDFDKFLTLSAVDGNGN